MTELAAAQQLRRIRGGRYRNPAGAELWAIEPLHLIATLSKYTSQFGSTFGDIWVVESRSELFGNDLHLATPEGLVACGYTLISEPAGGAE